MRISTAKAEVQTLRSALMLSTAMLTACLFLLDPQAANAETITWDAEPGGTAAPGTTGEAGDSAVSSGNGDWNVGTLNWTNDGGDTNRTFVTGDDVRFTATGGGTVTIAGASTIRPGSILFGANNYVITGGSIGTSGGQTIDTNAGVTATIASNITGSGAISVNSAGTGILILSGNSDGTGDLTVDGGTLRVTGSINNNVINNATLDHSGTITGQLLANGGTVNNTGSVDNPVPNASTVAVAGGVFNQQVGGQIIGRTRVRSGGILNANGGTFTDRINLNDGFANINADTNVSVNNTDGVLDVGAGITMGGNVTQTGGSTDNDGTITGTVDLSLGTFNQGADAIVGGLVTVDGGILNANGGSFTTGILHTAGTVNFNADTSAGTIENEAGTMNINAGITLAARVLVTGGTVNNSGEVANPALGASSVDVAGGTFNQLAGGVITGRTRVRNDGILNANGGTFTDVINLDDGTANINANTTVDVNVNDIDGALNIAAGITLGGDIVQSAGTTDNRGIVAGDVALSGGSFENRSGAQLSGTATVSGAGVLNARGGTFANPIAMTGGTTNILGNTSVNVGKSAGSLVIASGVTQTGGIVNSGGTTVNNGTVTLNVTASGGSYTQNAGGTTGGTATASSTGTIFAAGGIFTGGIINNGGTVSVTGNVIANLTHNDGDSTIQATRILTGNLTQADGDVLNLGEITGTVQVSGGNFQQNTGGRVGLLASVTSGGIITANGGTFAGGLQNDGGAINVTAGTTGNLRNNSGTSTIASTGLITGTVNQVAGNVRNNGDIGGTVSVAGGTFTQTATGTTSGLLTATGGVVAANGGVFTAGVRNDGADVTVVNSVSGDFTNQSGSTTIDADGILTGDVVVSGGTGIVSGRVIGALRVTGGAARTTAGSSVTAATRVATGGILNADGGTFGGSGITSTGGTINVRGVVTGNIDNASGQLNIGEGRTVVGDVTSTSNTTNEGTIDGRATISDGVFNQLSTAATTGLTVVNGTGTLNANGGSFAGGIDVRAGTANINNSTTANVENSGGTVVVDAGRSLRGNLTNTGGSTTNSGTITGALVVSDGTVTNATGAEVTGAASVTGNGVLEVNGGTFAGGITNAGETNINGVARADVTNSGGILRVRTGSQLNGSVTNTAGTTLSAATITGDVAVEGGRLEANAGSDVTGLTTISGGTINGNGGNFTGGIRNTGGEINLTDNTRASINNAAGSLTVNSGATLTGNVLNSGALSLAGNLNGGLTNAGSADVRGTISGSVTNLSGGEVTIGDRISAIGGTFTNQSGATFNLAAGRIFATGSVLAAPSATFAPAGATTGFFNEAGAQLNTRGTLNGPLFNSGTVSAVDAVFGGRVDNSGTIRSQGTTTLNGGLINDGTLDLTGSASPTDRVVVNGTVSGNTRLKFNVNSDAGSNGRADSLLVKGGALTGRVTLDLDFKGTRSIVGKGIKLIDADDSFGTANNYTLGTTVGLPAAGEKFVYATPKEASTGDTYLSVAVNPGISGLAGNISLTQSLIGSVINRPSSPFVSGLAYEDENPCGTGLWGRALGGHATTTGATVTNGKSFDSKVSASYGGIQLGGDFACFNGYYKGWDLAFGGIGGINQGNTNQPVFAVDQTTGALTNIQTSETKAKFDQYYGGLYLAAVRGPLALDLQYRLERTDFKVSNAGVGTFTGLGLTDEKFGSRAQTLSGSASYSFPIADTPYTVVPTAGFAWTRTKTDDVTFDNGDQLAINDFDNKTGFIGATIARTKIAEDGTSALNQFLTATFYKDFASGPTSSFTFETDKKGVFQSDNLSNDNLGQYVEFSAGVSYVKILDEGKIGKARQLSASVRADARVGKQLDSWGVTGQVRLQF